MPQNITPSSATYPDPVVAPSDGDDLDAASVLVGLQTLADRDQYQHVRLYENLPGYHNGSGFGAGYIVPLGAPMYNSSNRFSVSADFLWTQTDVTDFGLLVFPVTLPKLCKIKRFNAVAVAGAGNAVAPLSIDVSPIITLNRVPVMSTAGIDEVIATLDYNVAGAPATSAAYKAWHILSTTSFLAGSDTITSHAYQYFVRVLGEDNTNAATGWTIRSITLEVGAS